MHILSSKYLNCTLLAKTGCGTSLHGPQTSHLPYATAYTVWICYLATATLRTVTRLSWTWKKNRYTYRVFQWFSVAERGAPSSQCVTWATNCTTLVRCSARSVGDAADSFEFRCLFTPCPRRHWASTFSWRTLNYASFFINTHTHTRTHTHTHVRLLDERLTDRNLNNDTARPNVSFKMQL